MATANVGSTDHEISRNGAHTIGVARLAAAGAMTAAVVFALCWIGTFIAFSSPTHAYIGLFTSADTSSLEALAEGGGWSFLFGGLVGALFASLYNVLAGIDRR